MKNTSTLFSVLLLCVSANAQGVFGNQTSNTLEKVVQDYPSQFKNIKGEMVSSAKGATEYKSNVSIPGSVSTIITQSTSGKQAICWQSVVFADNNFSVARNRFEALFNQIKNTIIKPAGEKAVIVNGMYTDPSEDKNFTTIQFDLLPPSGITQRLNIDLAMKSVGNQWRIILSVYDKDRKESEEMLAK